MQASSLSCQSDKAGQPPAVFEKVLLIDDHALFAQALAGLICQEQLALSVITASTLKSAVAHLRQDAGVDLVLLDLALDGETGLSLLPSLAGADHIPPVVIISSSEDESTVRAARAAGAVGFLAKSAGRAALVRMMQAVRRGQGYFPGGIAPLAQGAPLTRRQLEVLALLAQGFPNKRICQSLGLTEHTVKTHLKAIFSQLGVHNRTECVSRARAAGWL
ncbi:response regulator transcription factor [Marinobacter sp. VGCF2001]|uniref:response regulator transcription factor n=1 Tax=Marinobacter sp. VGCF2001 TaxID=3417189 RepID=UPI003CEB440D